MIKLGSCGAGLYPAQADLQSASRGWLRNLGRQHHFPSVTTFYRRRLPHLQVGERPIFLTWRLHASLPHHRVFPAESPAGRAFVAMDRLLDGATAGPLHLRRPEIASVAVDAIRYGQDHLNYYRLHAYVVMANHIHLLLTPQVDVAKITHSLKRFIARRANQILGSTGQPFWQDESYDHLGSRSS